MAIKQSDIEKIREALIKSERPLIFYDDDPDGLISFLLIYRMLQGKPKGILVKSTPELKEEYASKVDEYSPDLVLVLDKPMISDGFISRVQIPIYWIDHHEPQKPRGTNYYNPRIEDDLDNSPTSYQAYKISNKPEDLWLAMTGIVSDWHLTEYKDEFIKKYPDLLTKEQDTPPKALFDSELGTLARVVSFGLKGKSGNVSKIIKILSRVESPYEILKQTSSRGRLLFKYYEHMNEDYQRLMKTINTSHPKLIFYTYDDEKVSFTSDLSNELLHRNPGKVIIIARKKGDEYKMSLRSTKHDLPKILEGVFKEIEGYGGGHTNACGAVIKTKDKTKFAELFTQKL